jgi:hypothetical protein
VCVKEVVSPAVSVAVAMGGESTHRQQAIKEKRANSAVPQLEL